MSSHMNESRPQQFRGGPGGRRMGGGFGPGAMMGRPVEKAKDFKGTFRRLAGYLKPHRVNLLVVFFFAIASTTFTIYAPQETKKAMNAVQDSFVARMVLTNVSSGREKAAAAIEERMAGAQTAAVDAVAESLAGFQRIALEQLGRQEPILKRQASRLPAGTLEAVAAFRALPRLDTLSDPAEKAKTSLALIGFLKTYRSLAGAVPPSAQGSQALPDQATVEAAGKLLALPLIASVEDPSRKLEVTRDVLDLLESIPAGAEMDPSTLKAARGFLALPDIDTVSDPARKAEIARTMVDLMKRMPPVGAVSAGGSSMNLTPEQLEGALRAVAATNGKVDFGAIGKIALILVVMYLMSAGFGLAMGLVMSGVSQKTVRDLRREVDAKLSRLPLKYFDMHPHGDILSRLTNDVDTIANTLQQSLTQIITSVISLLGYIIMMLTISPVLTLIVICTLPLYVLATMTIAKQSQKFFAAQQKELGALSGHVEEMYTGHKIVKAFGHEKASIGQFESINGRLYDAGWKAQFVSGVMFPLMNFISNLGYVLICIVGGIWITKNLLKIGDIIAFIQYSRSFTQPIMQTANIANIIQSTVACAERVFEVLDEPEEQPDSADAKTVASPRGEVAFEKVDFRYREDVPLIGNMNLDVKEGRTIAIVGPTGAGKTTLVNLLMRFYELNAGKITVDGIDIRELRRSDLRRMFGMVLQDTWLFNGTIRDNIAYGKPDATMEEIVAAAKTAHADHFIRTLPEGYDTVLNEEASNISQGQKQLLTIARAVLADPSILILDEATSSVDTRTEVLIRKAMAALMKDRTSFVIAHRLSTIRDAELILVMNKGAIVEQGTHKELLEKCGFYAELYNSQFSGRDLEKEAV